MKRRTQALLQSRDQSVKVRIAARGQVGDVAELRIRTKACFWATVPSPGGG